MDIMRDTHAYDAYSMKGQMLAKTKAASKNWAYEQAADHRRLFMSRNPANWQLALTLHFDGRHSGEVNGQRWKALQELTADCLIDRQVVLNEWTREDWDARCFMATRLKVEVEDKANLIDKAVDILRNLFLASKARAEMLNDKELSFFFWVTYYWEGTNSWDQSDSIGVQFFGNHSTYESAINQMLNPQK